jgi:tetratricopeptide (TPR) repeat protein
VLAHHAERAFSFSADVRAHQEVLVPRARRALEWALALGDRGRRREDVGLLSPNAGVAVAAIAALGSEATPDEHAHVALLVAEDRRLSGDYLPATAAFERSFQLAVAAGRTDLAAWSRLGLARVLVLSADFDAATMVRFQRDTADAARLFVESGDPGAALEAGLIGLESFWASGQLTEMLARGRALRERAQQLGDGARELLICARLIGAAGQSGDSERAAEYQRAVEELVARLGLRMPQWGRIARCQQLRNSGDALAADACFRAMYADGIAERDLVLQLTSLRNRGETLLDAGRPADARPMLEQALVESIRSGELWSRTELTAGLGQVAAAEGDAARARDLIRDAEALARETDLYAIAYVAFSAGRVNDLAGRPAEAEAAYRRALAVLAETEYVFRAALVRLTLVEFLLAHGRAADAKREFDVADPFLRHQVAEGARRVAVVREALALPRTAG